MKQLASDLARKRRRFEFDMSGTLLLMPGDETESACGCVAGRAVMLSVPLTELWDAPGVQSAGTGWRMLDWAFVRKVACEWLGLDCSEATKLFRTECWPAHIKADAEQHGERHAAVKLLREMAESEGR